MEHHQNKNSKAFVAAGMHKLCAVQGCCECAVHSKKSLIILVTECEEQAAL